MSSNNPEPPAKDPSDAEASPRGNDSVSIEALTLAAGGIGTFSATLRGRILPVGAGVLEQGFEYWTWSARYNERGELRITFDDEAEVRTVTAGADSGGEISFRLSGLSTGIEYRFRAYARTPSGTVYGRTLSFATEMIVTKVTTASAAGIDSASVLLKGKVEAGFEEIRDRGFEYRIAGRRAQAESGYADAGGNMILPLRDLPARAACSFRAFVKTADGTLYGEVSSFEMPLPVAPTAPADDEVDSDEKTFAPKIDYPYAPPGLAAYLPSYQIEIPATVTTADASGISASAATLRGRVTAGTEEILGQGFLCRSASGEVRRAAGFLDLQGNMVAPLRLLDADSGYTFRAYVKTGRGTLYGDERSFATRKR